ncbi:hypothetical protein JOM56_001320 [Amanita muscaria]
MAGASGRIDCRLPGGRALGFPQEAEEVECSGDLVDCTGQSKIQWRWASRIADCAEAVLDLTALELFRIDEGGLLDLRLCGGSLKIRTAERRKTLWERSVAKISHVEARRFVNCGLVKFDNGGAVGNHELREGNSDSRLSMGLSTLFTLDDIAIHTSTDSTTAAPYPREQAREIIEFWLSHNVHWARRLVGKHSVDRGGSLSRAAVSRQLTMRMSDCGSLKGRLGTGAGNVERVMNHVRAILFSESYDRELLYSIDGDHRGCCPFPSKRRRGDDPGISWACHKCLLLGTMQSPRSSTHLLLKPQRNHSRAARRLFSVDGYALEGCQGLQESRLICMSSGVREQRSGCSAAVEHVKRRSEDHEGLMKQGRLNADHAWSHIYESTEGPRKLVYGENVLGMKGDHSHFLVLMTWVDNPTDRQSVHGAYKRGRVVTTLALIRIWQRSKSRRPFKGGLCIGCPGPHEMVRFFNFHAAVYIHCSWAEENDVWDVLDHVRWSEGSKKLSKELCTRWYHRSAVLYQQSELEGGQRTGDHEKVVGEMDIKWELCPGGIVDCCNGLMRWPFLGEGGHCLRSPGPCEMVRRFSGSAITSSSDVHIALATEALETMESRRSGSRDHKEVVIDLESSKELCT